MSFGPGARCAPPQAPSRRDRRAFLAGCAAAAWAGATLRVTAGAPKPAIEPEDASTAGKALVAMTLDLEMSRNFPKWEDTHWDYEKGNLNEETKQYAVAAARKVAEYDGRLHFFVVGRVLEQDNVDWLKELAKLGCPLGNHTYDHVNVTATTLEAVQFRFQRAPWLVAGREPRDVIADNIRLASAAMRDRLGVDPAGFRTPGGFNAGLHERSDVQAMLLSLGYPWVSSQYPAHAMPGAGQRPGEETYRAIVEAQKIAQPYVYESGLVEVPMSPVSDVTAFRSGRWTLEEFLEGVRRGLAWCLENKAAYDFLGHPSCLYVVDPKMQAIDLICRMTKEAGERAMFADLGMLARRGASNGLRQA